MTLRVGLVGCGRWGRLIMRDLIELGAAVAVAAPSAETRSAAIGLGAAAAVPRASDLPACDGYIVAVPTVAHATAVRELLPRGVPIFVEKPLTCDEADAQHILEAAPDRVFCMDKWRYHGGVKALATLFREGVLGKIESVQTWRLGWGNPHRDVDAVWILAPHDLSIALEILGHLPPVHLAFGSRGPLGESLTAVLADGEKSAMPRVILQLSSTHPVTRRSVVVIGSLGAAQCGDSYDDYILLNRAGSATPEKIPVSTEMPLRAEVAAFLHHLAGGPPPLSSAADAVLVVRRVAAIRRMAGFDR